MKIIKLNFREWVLAKKTVTIDGLKFKRNNEDLNFPEKVKQALEYNKYLSDQFRNEPEPVSFIVDHVGLPLIGQNQTPLGTRPSTDTFRLTPSPTSKKKLLQLSNAYRSEEKPRNKYKYTRRDIDPRRQINDGLNFMHEMADQAMKEFKARASVSPQMRDNRKSSDDNSFEKEVPFLVDGEKGQKEGIEKFVVSDSNQESSSAILEGRGEPKMTDTATLGTGMKSLRSQSQPFLPERFSGLTPINEEESRQEGETLIRTRAMIDPTRGTWQGFSSLEKSHPISNETKASTYKSPQNSNRTGNSLGKRSMSLVRNKNEDMLGSGTRDRDTNIFSLGAMGARQNEYMGGDLNQAKVLQLELQVNRQNRSQYGSKNTKIAYGSNKYWSHTHDKM
jgi:hypothetical protein